MLSDFLLFTARLTTPDRRKYPQIAVNHRKSSQTPAQTLTVIQKHTTFAPSFERMAVLFLCAHRKSPIHRKQGSRYQRNSLTNQPKPKTRSAFPPLKGD